MLVGWLVGWLVGNAIFSETSLRIFLIFCMKLGDYEVEKPQGRIFEKNPRFGDIREKISKLAQKKDTFIFFSKTALMIFLVFGVKLVLNMTFNLNETFFPEKIYNLKIFDLEIVKKLPKLMFVAIFWTLHH